ncbi:hypothetical protein AGRA3207_007497 [Actinomadura graeca]|uniref:Uncharacterized protein n=1 Tax=Actinomadura graeca TaxID=2750812 RepID=A0ABX8RAB9_9ACTN|nr:hypothetical protein [Actinomadura graeca]QXJ25928.1 hypothetical protein AGRA3207_007497 [Actinomadura graeca]
MQHALEPVLEFIGQATLADLDQVEAAIVPRRRAVLRAWRAGLSGGEAVMIVDTSPVVFQGLTGTVVSQAPGKKASYLIRLDTRSTDLLRHGGGTRVYVPPGVREHQTTVPLGCLIPYQP